MGYAIITDNSELTLVSATSEEPSSRSNLESFFLNERLLSSGGEVAFEIGVFALTAKDQTLLGGFVRLAVAFITSFAVVGAYHDSGHCNQ